MTVQETKDRFHPGMKIRLLEMDDRQAPPPGTEGTVTGVDDIGSVMVTWDTGSHLNLMPDIDRYEIIG